MHTPTALTLRPFKHLKPMSQTPPMFQGPPHFSPFNLAHAVQQPQVRESPISLPLQFSSDNKGQVTCAHGRQVRAWVVVRMAENARIIKRAVFMMIVGEDQCFYTQQVVKILSLHFRKAAF